MTHVFFHVGMPKCASSTVQAYFNKYDFDNRKHGVCYPGEYRSQGGYFSHEPLARISPNQIEPALDKISEEAQSAATIFLSSEEFVNSRWDHDVTRKLIRGLNERFGAKNVSFLFIIRNHISFIESAYAQFLKGGLFRVDAKRLFKETEGAVSNYCNFFREKNGFDFFSFSHFIKHFLSLSGNKNKPLVLSTEKADNEQGDVLITLCELLKLPVQSFPMPRNKRFSSRALLALRMALQEFPVKEVRQHRRIIQNRFADCAEGFSPILHVDSKLQAQVSSIQIQDKKYLQQISKSDFPGVFKEINLMHKKEEEIYLCEEDKLFIKSLLR